MRKGILKGRLNILSALLLVVSAVMAVPMLSSCGKESAASPTGLNTQLNIINVGPDVYPVDLYIASRIQNTRSYVYGVPSGYVYLASQNTPIQVRATRQTTAGESIIIFQKDTALSVNTRYTLFITGLISDNTRSTIFVVDTDAVPSLGRGKVRFINASARAVNVDVTANATSAFKNQGFKAVTKYLEIPAGIYDFKVFAANTTTVLSDLPNTTIQDGRLYTLYTRGVVGRTDSAAFTAALLTNR